MVARGFPKAKAVGSSPTMGYNQVFASVILHFLLSSSLSGSNEHHLHITFTRNATTWGYVSYLGYVQILTNF